MPARRRRSVPLRTADHPPMKKKTILTLILLTSGALTLPAQTASVVDPPSVSATLTPAFVSQYMFRGQRLGGFSFDPNIEVDYGHLGVGIWSNFPLNAKVTGVSDPEVDPYVCYTIKANDTVSIVPGATLYTFPNADTVNGFYRTTFEPNVAVLISLPGGVTVTPKVYYDLVLDGPTYEITGAYAVPLKDIGSEIDLTATYGDYVFKDAAKDASPTVKQVGTYWLIGAAMPFQITKEATLTIGFAYTKGENASFKQAGTPKSDNPLAVGRGVVTVSYAYAF